MAMASNLVAVGSQSHVTLLDPRLAQPSITAQSSIDPGQVCASLPLLRSPPLMRQ